ncbi:MULTISPECIES: hypothetical protein [unclassified Rhizobium]|uniref:hypothetical protein n=1 Tax=unclassified Rhizobium TaxID=2613769 RepID=UPI0021677843|nr:MULTISPECIES: hypothetical protein [unclassified Rhizobium]MCS3743320.1 hypothetical protein [Rhizobium sp. BK661]MCS4096470.1 hypothetical protein [Rhizobium sp. BK176]
MRLACPNGITSPSGDEIRLSIHRSFEEGPLPSNVTTSLTEISHASFAPRLKFQQIKSTVDAMEALGIWAGAL